jgi:hypothetical protein
MSARKVTKRQAQAVLQSVREQFAQYIGDSPEYGPKFVPEWRYLRDEGQPAIVWEEGPSDWPFYMEFPTLPGVWVETATHFAITIYREA